MRELTGGIYFGEKTRTDDSASDLCVYTAAEIERIARVAFARRALEGHERRQGQRAGDLPPVARGRAPGARRRSSRTSSSSTLLVDNAAMQLVTAPRHFDVILTENMFGDILSDEAAMITGSIGTAAQRLARRRGGPGLFEPVHGSAPDIAGQGIANPLAMFLSAALMLRHGLGRESEAAAVESAVDRALDEGLRTRDLGGDRHARPRPRRPCSRTSMSKEHDVEQADLIWMNGEFVAWEDAKVHVLTHGLHYGTGVFEGVRCYDTEIGPAVFRHVDHLDRLFKSAELYYMPIPYDARAAAPGDARADRPQRPARLLHPPDRLPRLRHDGPLPARRAGRRVDRRRGSGAPTSARRASATASAPRSRRWRRISSDSLIPHAKASGQYLNSILAKIESHKAGYEEAILLDDHGHVCEGSGENIFVVRDGDDLHAAADRRDPRRHQPQVGASRSRATSASRSSSATSRAPSSTWPTRSS